MVLRRKDQPLLPDDIRAALERALASAPFNHAPKLTRFLRFVEMTLAGRADRLKGYTIGVEALGRREDFDPQVDPIVRVEAIRLRAALARYYSAAGAADPVAIEIPRGGYVPRFGWRECPRIRGRAHLADAVRKIRRLLSLRLVLQAPPDPS